MNKDLYEIYRACRLCGVGAGYKMPIIQSIVIDDDEIELQQKIRDCVQIEVTQNDRMPPLICELCVDKVQDFYEFRKMCQETNKKTRTRLRLPLEKLQSPSESNCNSGVTEPLKSDLDDTEPLSKQATGKSKSKSTKTKKEINNSMKWGLDHMRATLARRLGYSRAGADPSDEQPIVVEESRSPSPAEPPPAPARETGRQARRETRRRHAPSPKRVTRQNKTDDTALAQLLFDDNALLVPRQKRPREVVLETLPPTKKTKFPPEPTRPDRTSKPGPKSSKEPPPPKPTPPLRPPPKAGPKSKKRETSPPPTKSNRAEPSPTLGPRSRRVEAPDPSPKSNKCEVTTTPVSKSKSKPGSPLPGPKCRKADVSAVPTTKITRRDVSTPGPGPKSRKVREASPRATEKAPEKAPEKASYECKVCGVKSKNGQGFASHMKVHAPTLTPARNACNPCEVWFSSAEEAARHHRQHATGRPYTCTRCYDDFRTTLHYDLHLERAQCLPTFEVPDVKCDSCWQMFPTYRLLEEHRCAGEGGRPGGKCPNCRRTYASQKSLAVHEMRCTVKKKVEPAPAQVEGVPGVVEGESSGVRVRIVRCDSLLTSRRGTYHVGRLSREFGLDRNCIYPYLPTDDAPRERDSYYVRDIKREYSTRDDNNEVRWDSDDSDDRSISNKSVNSLCSMSLKTLLSPKCLGEASGKEPKVRSEIESDSILGISLHEDIGTNIDNIIDSLARESSNDYDSDSILDKNLEKKDDSDGVVDSLKTKTDADPTDGTSEVKDMETNKTDIDDNGLCNNDDVSENANLNRPETNDQIDASRLNENIDVFNENSNQSTGYSEVNENVEVTNYSEKVDENKPKSPKNGNDGYKTTENNELNLEPTQDVENNEICRNSPKNGDIVSNDISKDESLLIGDKVENGTAQTESECMDVDEKQPEPSSEDMSKFISSDVEMSEQTTEKLTVSNDDDKVDTQVDTESSDMIKTIEHVNVDIVGSQCNNSDDKINENNEPSYAVNGETNDSGDSNDNANEDSCSTTHEKPNETDDNVKDDANNTKPCPENDSTDTDTNYSRNTEAKKESEEPVEPNLVDSKESLITENDLFDNETVQCVDKFNINYLDDEDKLLMDELDAQIGENQPENNTVGENRLQSAVIGENNAVTGEDSSVTSENSAVTGENSAVTGENSQVIGENSSVTGENSQVIGENSSVTGENSQVVGENSQVIGENGDSTRNYCPVGITNEGFSEEKDDGFDVLLNQQNDLKSLDLDNISDEEFNFDI